MIIAEYLSLLIFQIIQLPFFFLQCMCRILRETHRGMVGRSSKQCSNFQQVAETKFCVRAGCSGSIENSDTARRGQSRLFTAGENKSVQEENINQHFRPVGIEVDYEFKCITQRTNMYIVHYMRSSAD